MWEQQQQNEKAKRKTTKEKEREKEWKYPAAYTGEVPLKFVVASAQREQNREGEHSSLFS